MDDLRAKVRARMAVQARFSSPVRVLVVGPMTDGGGMAQVARMSADSFDPLRLDVAVCDTSKGTRPGRWLLEAVGSHLARGFRLFAALRRHKPQVVHLHTCSYRTFERTIVDCWLCSVFRRPYVLHVHGGLFAKYLQGLSGVRRSLAFGALRRARRVAVLSAGWRAQLASIVEGAQFCVISNAIAPPAEPSTEVRGSGILFVGDLSEVKRPEDAIVAYASLSSDLRRRFPLTIVGGGDAARSAFLVRLADRLGLGDAVQFDGHLAQDEVRSRMRRADLLVMPSRAEGMPLVLLEAMHAELPAVVTDVGAIAEMVRDGIEARIVPACNPARLVKAMKELLTDSPRRESMGRAARLRAESQFTVPQFHDTLFDLWTDVATEAQPAAAMPVPRLAAPGLRSLL